MMKSFKNKTTEDIYNSKATKAALETALRWDLYFAQESETDELRNIKPISPHMIPFNESRA